jgi:alkylhydroperoxidase family enzyme
MIVTMEDNVTAADRIKLQRHAVGALQAFAQIEKILADSGLPTGLRHLVKLRASQINSCAYNVKRYFSDEEVAAPAVVIAMTNLWNRSLIAAHGGSHHDAA